MRVSAFGNKVDNRTVHQKFCDYEVAKAIRPRSYGGTRVIKKATGIKRNDYTTSELISLLTF